MDEQHYSGWSGYWRKEAAAGRGLESGLLNPPVTVTPLRRLSLYLIQETIGDVPSSGCCNCVNSDCP